MQLKQLFRVVSAAMLALVLCLLPAVSQTRAAVTLISFEATAEPGKVTLSWETATELGTSGFYVVSSDSADGGYVRISPFISATGGGLSGATYSYTDDGLTDGQTYYYKLEMVEVDNSSDFSTAISAVPGAATPTATRSATPTASPTASRTPSATAATPQPQPTSAPTDSAYPGPAATATSAAYPGPQPTRPNPAYPGAATSPAPTSAPAQITVTVQPTTQQSLAGAAQSPGNATGPTATLIPQPEIAILLPVASPLPTVAVGSGELAAGSQQEQAGFTWTRVGPLAFIAVIWIMLGGWFYLSLRQME